MWITGDVTAHLGHVAVVDAVPAASPTFMQQGSSGIFSGPSDKVHLSFAKSTMSLYLLGIPGKWERPVSPIMFIEGRFATTMIDIAKENGMDVVPMHESQYLALGVDFRSVHMAAKYHGCYGVFKQGNLYAVLFLTPTSSQCADTWFSFNCHAKQDSLVSSVKVARYLLTGSETNVPLENLEDLFGPNAKRFQFNPHAAKQLVDMKLAENIAQVEALNGAQFLQVLGVYYHAKSMLGENKERLFQLFGARARRAVAENNGVELAALAGLFYKARASVLDEKKERFIQLFGDRARAAVAENNGVELAALAGLCSWVDYALRMKDEIVAKGRSTEEVFARCDGIELATIGAVHARPDASTTQAEYMRSRTPREVQTTGEATSGTRTKKRCDVVELCNHFKVPGANRQFPAKFTEWHVQEWSNGAVRTYGAENHSKHKGHSRKTAQTMLQDMGIDLDKADPKIRVQYRHLFNVRPAKAECNARARKKRRTRA